MFTQWPFNGGVKLRWGVSVLHLHLYTYLLHTTLTFISEISRGSIQIKEASRSFQMKIETSGGIYFCTMSQERDVPYEVDMVEVVPGLEVWRIKNKFMSLDKTSSQ